MREMHKKYILKLSDALNSVILVSNACNRLPVEKVDERIEAISKCISVLQEARRYLVYFKNTEIREDTTPKEKPTT